jgi:hypothetical protein
MDYVAKFVEPGLGTGTRNAATDLYLSFFREATADDVPPYFRKEYGESFRRHVLSPVWVIQCLISNSIKEGEGSRDLSALANACPRQDLQEQLIEHLEDEARHCRLYLGLVEIVFPGSLPQDVLDEVNRRLPPLRHRPNNASPLSDWELLDNLIQINLGEVRTRIHQHLLEPVLHAYCADSRRQKLTGALRWLASDELRHIKYTAERIGELGSADISAARSLFIGRSRQFSAYTDRELGVQREGLFAS